MDKRVCLFMWWNTVRKLRETKAKLALSICARTYADLKNISFSYRVKVAKHKNDKYVFHNAYVYGIIEWGKLCYSDQQHISGRLRPGLAGKECYRRLKLFGLDQSCGSTQICILQHSLGCTLKVDGLFYMICATAKLPC